MSAERDLRQTEAFLAVATSQALLSTDVAAQAGREAGARGVEAAQLVLEKGLMDAVEVDIVETLLDPKNAVPGYEVLSLLGRGGMGIVYQARQLALGRVVAIKMVLLKVLAFPGMAERFEIEARTVAGLQHPNIVAAYDFGRHGGRLFFVMELLQGETLEALVKRRGPLSEAMAWGLARQTASGLAEAARQGVVHRDIKPANLFVVEPPLGVGLPAGMPLLKITDFGLVLRAHEADSDVRLTAAGTSLGTPLYMAPEQFTSSEVDYRADIYSLGETVFFLLRGAPTFTSKKYAEILIEKTQRARPPLEGFSPASTELLAAMLERDPARRVGSYPDLLDRIDRLLAGPQSSGAFPTLKVATALENTPMVADGARNVSEGRPSLTLRAPWLWRRWPGVVAASLLCLIVVGAGIFFLRPRGFPPRTLVSSGRILPLFNGVNVNPPDWMPRRGLWTPARDAEGGAVLSGEGHVRRRLPNWPSYRISMGVDLNKADAVEMHFGLTATGADPPRLVLRASRDGVTLGRRASDEAPFQPLTKALAYPTATTDDGPVYHELRVDRHGKVWWAFFRGQSIGAAVAGEEIEEFRLVTEKGPALFDTLEVAELVPPK